MKKLFSRKQNQKGFTLIETLVAVAILVVAIVGPMDIASKGLFSAFYARDEITAYFLAQEGVEFVRNTRDTNYINKINGYVLSDTSWLEGLDSCVSDSNEYGCDVDSSWLISDQRELISDAVIGLEASDNPVLKYDEDEAYYSYDSRDPDSKFKRKILIIPDGAPASSASSALIEATVTWTTGAVFGSTRSFTLRERIFNWNR